MKVLLNVVTCIVIAGVPLAADAQWASEYVAPQVLGTGPSVTAPSGAGSVMVQVFVKKDGTFEIVKVLKSSNPGDNAAALEIAKQSKYKPATSDGKPVDAYYDYAITFADGPAATRAEPVAVSPAAAQSYEQSARAALDAQRYTDAVDAAGRAIDLDPKNEQAYYVRGVAEAWLKSDAAAGADLQAALSIAAAAKADDTAISKIAFTLASVQINDAQYAQAATTAKDVASDPTQYAALNKYALYAMVSAANARVNQGKIAEAVQQLELGAAEFPAVAGPLIAQASYILAIGKHPDWAKVALEARKALMLDSGEGHAEYVLGYAAASQRDTQGALAYMYKARDTADYHSDPNLAKQVDTAILLLGKARSFGIDPGSQFYQPVAPSGSASLFLKH